jgi:triphosphatase
VLPVSEDRIEAEWQYDVSDLGPPDEWLSHPPPSLQVALTDGVAKEHLDTYYDTADWRIYRGGYALRLRRKNGQAELTLKSLNPRQAGFSTRREVTQQLASIDDIAIEQLEGPVGDRVQALRGCNSINPLFSAITRRRTYSVWSEGRQIGEVALDNTTYIGETFDDQSQLLRVEIESTNGEIDRLEPFVAILLADLALEPATGSKFVTGLTINGLAPTEPLTLSGTTFDRASTITGVAYAILRRQLTELIRREPGTRLGDDEEELHDMRVAARRMRAALSLFSTFLSPEFEAMREELRWVAAALGEVRDLDVQLGEISDWAARVDEADRGALSGLLDELRRRRLGARERMLTVLDSERYDRFIADFAALLSNDGDAPASGPVLSIAPDLVLRRQAKFGKKADRIEPDSANEAFHAVRIDAKRLRYALEFFSSLYGEGVADYIRQVVMVQDLIGKHQDAIVAIDHLRELAAEATTLSGPTIFAMGRIAEQYAESAGRIRVQFPEVYRELGARRLKRLEAELRAAAKSKPSKQKRRRKRS